jgi:outer membrane protein OmpA-like peptidoglycan-associated protein
MACGAHAPPKELVDAREAYAKAEGGPAGKLVPAELHVARESLDVAEHAFSENPDAPDTIDVSYIALRRAQRADALGQAAASEGDRAKAEKNLTKTERAMLEDTEGRLKKTEGQLQHERGELVKQKEATEAERKARLEAEKKAQDAMDALAKSMAVKNEARGTVITLSGGVLFTTGEATLLPGAQSQLNQVAEALKTQAEHHFSVEGHTDNQGTDKINDELSTRRANSVRDYLIVHGVSAAAITAQGFGSSKPVADNKSAEGRAMNRRVEIVVSGN